MDSLIETHEVGTMTANVYYDSAPCINPRKDYDHLGTFFGFHRRYVSPDAPPSSDPEEARRIAESPDNICLRVWLYDHSGTSYRATVEHNPFTCPWDSGLFGFIYVSKEKVRKEYGCKKVGSRIRQRVIEVLKAEVSEWSAYANGEVYAWSVENENGIVLDSCHGYIGDRAGAERDAIDAARHFDSCDWGEAA